MRCAFITWWKGRVASLPITATERGGVNVAERAEPSLVGPARPMLLSDTMPAGRPIASLAVAAASGVAIACGSLSSAPIATKDRVIHDVDATELPPQPTVDLPPDSPFAPVEASSAFGSYYDAYAVLTICAPTPAPDAASDGKKGAANDAAYSTVDAAVSSACTPMPSACENEPDCECLFRALATEIPCEYPHCSAENGFTLYCP